MSLMLGLAESSPYQIALKHMHYDTQCLSRPAGKTSFMQVSLFVQVCECVFVPFCGRVRVRCGRV